MKTVKWYNDNHTRVIAEGFDSIEDAESAIDHMLFAEGDDHNCSYGRGQVSASEDEAGNSFYTATISIA